MPGTQTTFQLTFYSPNLLYLVSQKSFRSRNICLKQDICLYTSATDTNFIILHTTSQFNRICSFVKD